MAPSCCLLASNVLQIDRSCDRQEVNNKSVCAVHDGVQPVSVFSISNLLKSN